MSQFNDAEKWKEMPDYGMVSTWTRSRRVSKKHLKKKNYKEFKKIINFIFSEAQNLIQNTRNYTIFIKNDVEFRKFNKKE